MALCVSRAGNELPLNQSTGRTIQTSPIELLISITRGLPSHLLTVTAPSQKKPPTKRAGPNRRQRGSSALSEPANTPGVSEEAAVEPLSRRGILIQYAKSCC